MQCDKKNGFEDHEQLRVISLPALHAIVGVYCNNKNLYKLPSLKMGTAILTQLWKELNLTFRRKNSWNSFHKFILFQERKTVSCNCLQIYFLNLYVCHRRPLWTRKQRKFRATLNFIYKWIIFVALLDLVHFHEDNELENTFWGLASTFRIKICSFFRK